MNTMKITARSLAFVAWLAFPGLAAAQSGYEQEPGTDDGFYYDESAETQGDASTGVASYNIEDEEAWDENSGDYYSESGSSYAQQTETIRIYSGRHEGNNTVRTIQVALPEGSPSGGFSYREYEPH
jgi:hypothetical protein